MPKSTGQPRWQSLVETVAGVAIGYVVAVLSQLVILPWFGVQLTLSDNLLVAAYFTVVSLIRGYMVRRTFNWFWIWRNL